MMTSAIQAAQIAQAIIKAWNDDISTLFIFPGQTQVPQPADLNDPISGFTLLKNLINSLNVAKDRLKDWRSHVFSPQYNSINASLTRANNCLLGLDISANLSMYTAAINDVLHELCPTIPGQAKGCGPNFMVGKAGVVQAPVPINLQGPQYLSIALEDYTQSRPSSGLIGIAPQNTKLTIPSYANKHSRVFSAATTGYDQIKDLNASVICDGSSNVFGEGKSLFVPTWPRDLTQNQLYSVNQILSNQRATHPARRYAPDPHDILAVITLEDNTDAPTRVDHRQVNSKVYTRSYFGPVTIERLGIKLYDDKGNFLNLNGRDWSFTLRAEQLYQY